MAGAGVLGRVLSAARKAKSHKSGGASVRAQQEQATGTGAEEKSVEGLRLAEALLVLEQSYNGEGARECLEPAWIEHAAKHNPDLEFQTGDVGGEDSLLINGGASGMNSLLEPDSHEAQLLGPLRQRQDEAFQAESLDMRRSDPLPRLNHRAEQVLYEDQCHPAAAKSISGPLLSTGIPPVNSVQKQKAKSGPVLENQGSGRYAPGRLWRKETQTEHCADSRKSVASAHGTAGASSMFAGEPETLALWQAGPEDSAQVALSPPRRECWNNVYHHTQSVGNLAFSPVSENDSLRSQCSAEEVSSSQRPIEEAEEEQQQAAAAAAAAGVGPGMPVTSESPVVKPDQGQSRQSRLRGRHMEETSLMNIPRARNLAFSGPLCFDGAAVNKAAPPERLGFSMPLPTALQPDALAVQGIESYENLRMDEPVGKRDFAAASGDYMVLDEGAGEVREEVGEGMGPCLKLMDQECEAFRAWHDTQNQLREQAWRFDAALVPGEHGRCARSYSEELKGSMVEERPEELFLSGPLIQGSGGLMEAGNSAQMQQEERKETVLMPLEKSESGTRNTGRFSRYTEMDMEWENEDCVWGAGHVQPSGSHGRHVSGSGQNLGVDEACTGRGRFASGAYDPVGF